MTQQLNSVKELPKGWVATTLEELCLPVDKSSPRDTPGESFSYIDIAAIDNSTFRVVAPKVYLGRDAPSRARQKVNGGNILISTVRTYLKNTAMVPPDLDGAVASTGFCVLNPATEVNREFIFYFVLTDDFVSRLNPLQRGTSYPAVRNDNVLAQEIPFPPLTEQHRIAAEIEKQFTRLDASVAALERVRTSLMRYRASVLKAAGEGKLVTTEAELAKSEGRQYEHADELLERNLKKRRAQWESQPRGRKYKEAVAPDVSSLPTLPERWVWATVDQLAAPEPNSITDGPYGSNLKTAHYTDEGPRVIRLQNIGNGQFINAYAHISWDHFRSLHKHVIQAGDLVIAALGQTLPRSCIVPSTVGPAIVKADCIRFKPAKKLALAAFLNIALNTVSTRARTANTIHGVGRPRLNLGGIKNLSLPVPPLAEQQRIVAEVEHRMSILLKAEAAVHVSLNRAEQLRQSILTQAFSGRLVHQDPGDEPASKLLERISAERTDALAVWEANRKRGSGRQLKAKAAS